MADEIDLDELLKELDSDTKIELDSKPTVEAWTDNFDVTKLPVEARKWVQVPDLVAVVADLKNSTQLGTGKHAASTASIYQAATGGVVNIYAQFDADFVAIQGDGAFALFWGDLRYERAMCAGITVKTFSERHLVARLEKKWKDPEFPTGFKVGVSSGRVLVKRVGTPRNLARQEPVWAGKPVNYAAKAAQQADRHELIVTGSVWDKVEKNDYLSISCGCSGSVFTSSPKELWKDVTIEKVPSDDDERYGRLLSSTWCVNHGAEFCAAILAGKTKRNNVDEVRAKVAKSQMEEALRWKAARGRQERRRLRALSR
jgi:class 3 adenylate cyclase